MTIYLIRDGNKHDCGLPELTRVLYDGIPTVRAEVYISNVRTRIALGAVVGCRDCGAQYTLRDDPLMGGELVWQETKKCNDYAA